MVKAPVKIRASDDCLSEETLRIIADNLGEEWQRVAHYLNVKKMRIQAIMKNNLYKEADDTSKYDMLVTWIKKVPLRVNKVREDLYIVTLVTGKNSYILFFINMI